MTIISKIEKLIAENNVSDKEFCEKIGIVPSKLSDWKSGRIKSYTKYLPQIAEFFNVSVDYLLGTGENIPSLSELENRLILLFRMVKNVDEQKNVVETFSSIVKLTASYCETSSITDDINNTPQQSRIDKIV